ncbi:MAG: aldo/keto reductase [Acidobacteriota bacterium]
MTTSSSLNRRTFLGAGLASTTAALTALGTAPDKILNYQPGMRYRRLGKTDLYLSVLSLGGLVLEESVHHYAIDRGVNMVHVAEDYLGGQAIIRLGNVLKTRRKQVYVALKGNFGDLDRALKVLNTDYVDFVMFDRHSAAEAADPRIPETFAKYKQQGKVRFAGLTCHDDVKEATAAGIASGFYSLLMPALNQPQLEALDLELRQASEKGIGVMAMKTMRGLRERPLQLAFFKKLLANPAVTTVLKGIGSFDLFDAYLQAAQESLTAEEDRRLYHHAQVNRRTTCMMCGQCEAACPYGVEVSTVLRCADYYWEQLGDRETAVGTYAMVPVAKRGDSRCQLCAKCEETCPNRIPIVDKLQQARSTLSRLAC